MTAPTTPRSVHDRTARLVYIGPLLGFLAAGALVLTGLDPARDGGSTNLLSLVPVYIPPLMLALAVGNPPKNHPRRHVLLTTPAAAFGLVTVTLVVGSILLDTLAWWIGGAVGSAVPFVVVGLAARR
ncbi:hypothetical protein ACPYO6_13915 [Georgenia sp. Z1344]|uniref:hypothetical protein n=1 Tax=Georgenia sp. Z1344 TaxID=3416706 RepID=UPI003CFA5438